VDCLHRIVLTLEMLGAAAAAAMRVTHWSPVDAFLEPRRQQRPQKAFASRTTPDAGVTGSTRSSSKPYGPSTHSRAGRIRRSRHAGLEVLLCLLYCHNPYSFKRKT
jgi:hypothetical protein